MPNSKPRLPGSPKNSLNRKPSCATLNELLDFYTNRTIRTTQVVQRLSAPTYHTPRPVLRQIESELAMLAENDPGEAVDLVKVLWKANSLESRLLAAYLLGSIPFRPGHTHPDTPA